MKNQRHIILAIAALLILTLLTSGCATATETAATSLEPTEVQIEPTNPATATTAAEPEPSPTAVQPEPSEKPVSETETEVVLESSSCLDCHTDKELLIDTADPVMEDLTENEGAG